MDRTIRQLRGLTAVAATVAIVLCCGCTSLLFTPLYLIKGNNVDAVYPGLKGKTVAVVCRPAVSLTYRDAGNARVSQEVARQVSILLRSNVPKVHVIDSEKVSAWLDEAPTDDFDYAAMAEDLDADMVVAIDLQSFSILQGQTLYQGKASAIITVYDITGEGVPESGEVVFEDTLDQLVYPPNTAVESSSKPKAQFRREFVQVLANHVGRYFYAHDPYADFAMDAKSIKQ